MQFNKILPYLLSLVIFYLVTAAFFQEVAFKGKTLPQHDVIQYEGMSQWPNTHLEKTGERPLWNTGMFSGMPNYAVSFGVENWPVYSLRRLASKIFFTYPIPSLLLTNLICCWILLLSFNVKQKIATIGALVYGFNTFLIVTIEAGHLTKILALGLAALVIAGLRFTFSKKYLVGIPLLCTALAVELMMDHIQITYYLAMVCAVYAISALVVKLQEKDTKSVPVIIAIVLGASLLAVGTVVSKVWLMKEYSAYTIRGERLLTPTEQEKASKPEEGLSREYAFNWSEGKMESLTLLVPSFYGGGSGEKVREGSNVHELFERVAGAQRTRQLMKADQLKVPMYFGDQPFTSGPAYAGAITCFLFILGLLVAENRNRIWMGIGVLLTLFIAWGSNFSAFNYFLFDYFPLFNKFRSPSMALLLTIMLMTLLGFIGLNNVLNSKFTNEIKTKLLAASGITVGLLVIILLYSMMGDFSAPKDLSYGQQFFGDQSKTVSQFAAALAADRASFMRTDAFKGIILILIAVGLIWFYLKNSLAKVWVIAGIGLLTFGDMWIVAKRYLYDAKFEKNAVKSAHKKSKADDLILADQDPHYRVFNLRGAFQEAYTSYFHKSIGGYHAAKLRRYNDLIENRLAIEQQKLVQTLQSGSQDFSSLAH